MLLLLCFQRDTVQDQSCKQTSAKQEHEHALRVTNRVSFELIETLNTGFCLRVLRVQCSTQGTSDWLSETQLEWSTYTLETGIQISHIKRSTVHITIAFKCLCCRVKDIQSVYIDTTFFDPKYHQIPSRVSIYSPASYHIQAP